MHVYFNNKLIFELVKKLKKENSFSAMNDHYFQNTQKTIVL